MNILFLSLEIYESINEQNMYTDILREFIKNGHAVYSISPIERRYNTETYLVEENNSKLLRLKIGNMQKTNLIEKGLSMLFIEKQYIKGIQKYFAGIKFDIVLYVTPPITFCNVIEYVKRRDNSFTYLMLKDIFPQNAVDLGIIETKGVFVFLYNYFRSKEKKLYRLSDKIGCMSQANVDYILKHNKWIEEESVEICPNCVEVNDKFDDFIIKEKIRAKYEIPSEKKVFVYGGNLGKPQGIDFLIECIKSQKNNKDIFFLVVGDGTEYKKLENFAKIEMQKNFRLLKRLSTRDYNMLIRACDIGMIFLDYRFTIPNFPSRMLSYMQAKIPILACTDCNTDLGDIIENGNFGWWCESNDVRNFSKAINTILNTNISEKGEKAMIYLKKHYTNEIVYKIIMRELEK